MWPSLASYLRARLLGKSRIDDLSIYANLHHDVSIVLPIKKISLSEDHVSRPIPMLSDRQYVVSSSKLSAEEERSQRELFWYREELFKVVHGRWREVCSYNHLCRCNTWSEVRRRAVLEQVTCHCGNSGCRSRCWKPCALRLLGCG